MAGSLCLFSLSLMMKMQLMLHCLFVGEDACLELKVWRSEPSFSRQPLLLRASQSV